MKKLLMFVGLKISEILLIIFVPYWLGHIVPGAKEFRIDYWSYGLLTIIVFLGASILLILLSYFIFVQSILQWLSFNWKIIYKDRNNPFKDLLEKLY